MELKELKQYCDIVAEILELKTQINDNMVRDVVRGSDAEYPYLPGSISISGTTPTPENRMKLERLRSLEKKKSAIETFVYSIDDSLTRRIFELRFIKGLSWKKVAEITGGNNTSDSVKKVCYRYIYKNVSY